MLTADMARDISGNSSVDEALAKFEADIRRAAEYGRRDALLAYCDCMDGAKHAALDKLKRRGFEVFTMQETIGGVRQTPGWYARW